MAESKNQPLRNLVSLKGKVSLVTGAASGIGKAIAQRYAEAGSSLLLVDVDKEKLDNLPALFKKWAVKTTTYRVDLSKKGEIDLLWDEIGDNPPDVLVNNAGIFLFKKFEEVDEQFLDRIMDINLKAVFWMCQRMIKARINTGGVIVNISSIEAILPFKNGLNVYGPSKWGVLSLTRSLAKDYSKKGFRINAILPGGINTPGTRSAAKGILKLQFGIIKDGIEFMSRLPMGRLGKADEVARMATVLATDMSSYVTGAAIPVDGGFLSA